MTIKDEILERLRADKAALDAFGIGSVAVFGPLRTRILAEAVYA